MASQITEMLISSFRKGASSVQHFCGMRNYLLLMSVIVGVISGVAAVLLKSFANSGHELVEQICGTGPMAAFLLPLFPAIGIFGVILFVLLFVKGPYDKSLAGVIYSVTNGTGDIPKQKIFSHILTSGFCVGMGASAGLEAPIALTGSAIGANFGKLLMLGRESRIMLLACGGAAGISAVFNSPVAGTLFACEILLPEFSIPLLIPLLISSATAAVVSEVLYSNHPFIVNVTGWSMRNIPYYVLLGIACGLVASFVIHTAMSISVKFSKIPNVWIKGLIGSVILYVTFLLFPALRGEGYNFINCLIDGAESGIINGSPVAFLFHNPWCFLVLLAFLVFVKAAISSISIESGGDGGIFAPSMFVGAFLGYFMARGFKMLNLFGSDSINETNFIAVGMGGVLAGVMHAPMTGIFLIAEITGGYKLFIPLMIVASLSYFICRKLCRYNVYKSAIALRGGTPDASKDSAVIVDVTIEELLETDFMPVRQNDTLRTLLSTVMKSKRNLFPVLDDDDMLVGLVTLDNIRPFLLDTQLYDVALVYDIMSDTGPVLKNTDLLADATKLFETLRVWNLPVTNNGKYAGFVSKSGVFDRYRSILKHKQDLF